MTISPLEDLQSNPLQKDLIDQKNQVCISITWHLFIFDYFTMLNFIEACFTLLISDMMHWYKYYYITRWPKTWNIVSEYSLVCIYCTKVKIHGIVILCIHACCMTHWCARKYLLIWFLCCAWNGIIIFTYDAIQMSPALWHSIFSLPFLKLLHAIFLGHEVCYLICSQF